MQVFQSFETDHGFDQPVWRSGNEAGFVDTGQRMQVWLRNDYRDPHLLAKPNLSLLIIGFFALNT